VEFYRDGTVLVGTATAAPYSVSWSSTAASNGSHTFAAKAFDAAGNSTTSASITATVNNTVTPPSSWIKGIASPGTDGGNAVAVDSNGNLYTAGYFQGTITLGSITLTSVGSQNIVLAKYSAGGTLQWAERIGLGSETPAGIALDSGGNLFVAGSFSGTTDLSGARTAGSGTSLSTPSVFLAKYSNTGAYLWAKGFAASTANGVVVDSAGNVIITGSFQGTANFGGGPVTAYGFDTFLAKYTGAGQYLWVKTANTSNGAFPGGLAVDSANNIVLGGRFLGSINFGTGPVSSVSTMAYSAYLTKFSAAGSCLWTKVYGSSYAMMVAGVAVDSSANIYLTGDFYNSASLGSGTLSAYNGYGYAPYLAKYDLNGTPQWSLALVGPGGNSTYSTAVATDNNGNVWVTGYFPMTLNMGGGVTLSSAGGQNIFAARYSPSGTYLWSKSFGGPMYTYAGIAGLAIDASGSMLATGYFSGSANFGFQSLASAGGYDGFVLRLVP